MVSPLWRLEGDSGDDGDTEAPLRETWQQPETWKKSEQTVNDKQYSPLSLKEALHGLGST